MSRLFISLALTILSSCTIYPCNPRCGTYIKINCDFQQFYLASDYACARIRAEQQVRAMGHCHVQFIGIDCGQYIFRVVQ